MKKLWGVVVYLHTFLTAARVGAESSSRYGLFTIGKGPLVSRPILDIPQTMGKYKAFIYVEGYICIFLCDHLFILSVTIRLMEVVNVGDANALDTPSLSKHLEDRSAHEI